MPEEFTKQLFQQALQAQKSQNYDQALKLYHALLQQQPDNIEAHYNLGLLFLRQANLAAATKQFRNVISLFPQAVNAHEHLANIYLQQEQLDLAEKHYNLVLEQHPQDPDVLNNIGILYLKRNELQSALKQFGKALQADPKHASALNNMAATFLQLDRFEDAMTYYLHLLELEPHSLEAHYNLSVALMALGQLDKALEHLHYLVQQAPQHLAAHLNLAAIYLKLQQRTNALNHYQQVLQIQPEQPTARYMVQALTGQVAPDTAPSEYVKQLFDNYAGFFDKHLTKDLQYQTPKELHAALLPYIAHQAKLAILDLGCGTGLCGPFFRDFAKQLTGVDLSSKMLAVAKTKEFYDELLETDIQSFLMQQMSAWDIVIAADVLVYIGNLEAIVNHTYQALRPGGLFAFTTEMTEKADYQLQETGRYAHNSQYLARLATQTGFKSRQFKSIIARLQDDKPVYCYLSIWEK